MAISAASLVRKPGTETTAPRTARYAYPLLRAGQQTFQLVKIEDFKDDKYGKEMYGFMKVRFGFIQVIAGWDAAEGNPVAEEKMRQKGQGHWYSIECHPICSKP